MRTDRRDVKSGRGVWILLILTPVLSYVFLWILSGTAPWRIDAWNTQWNDELDYYRVVRLIRTWLRPQGVAGFNEVLTRHLTYGTYTPFTYLTYAAFSFLTGCDSHNYVYLINILMAVLANLIFVLLAEPDRKTTLWMSAFFLLNLVWARYVWSGMVEESYSFFMVIFAGLVLYENRCLDAMQRARGAFVRADGFPVTEGKGSHSGSHPVAAMAAMILLTAWFSLMRPYYVLLLLFPFYDFIRYRRGRQLLCRGEDHGAGSAPSFRSRPVWTITGAMLILLLIPALVLAFIYLRHNYVAIYFASAGDTVQNMVDLFFGGDLKGSLSTVIHSNTQALRTLAGGAGEMHFYTAVFLLDAAEWVMLAVLLVRAIREKTKDRQKIFTLAVFLLISAAVYEATVVLYKPVMVHRMTMACAAANGLVILYYGKRTRPALLCAAGVITLLLCVLNHSGGLLVPARSDQTLGAKEARVLTESLEQIMPHDEGGDPWNNTYARPLTKTRYYRDLFAMPVYLSDNTFSMKGLEEAIRAGTLRSRYLVLDLGPEKEQLRRLAQSRYEVLGTFDYVEVLLTTGSPEQEKGAETP